MLNSRYIFGALVIPSLLALATGCSDRSSGRVEWQSGPQSWPECGLTAGASVDLDGNVRNRSGVRIESRAHSLQSIGTPLTVSGSFDAIPKGWTAFAFLESPYGYHLQWPPVRLDRAHRTFRHRNIRIGDGITEVHVVLANPSAARLFERRAANNDWSVLPVLPDGVVICDTISLD